MKDKADISFVVDNIDCIVSIVILGFAAYHVSERVIHPPIYTLIHLRSFKVHLCIFFSSVDH